MSPASVSTRTPVAVSWMARTVTPSRGVTPRRRALDQGAVATLHEAILAVDRVGEILDADLGQGDAAGMRAMELAGEDLPAVRPVDRERGCGARMVVRQPDDAPVDLPPGAPELHLAPGAEDLVPVDDDGPAVGGQQVDAQPPRHLGQRIDPERMHPVRADIDAAMTPDVDRVGAAADALARLDMRHRQAAVRERKGRRQASRPGSHYHDIRFGHTALPRREKAGARRPGPDQAAFSRSNCPAGRNLYR